MNKTSLLNNISIVLVDTKTPANIGATARCMMNMGLPHLVLVRPPKDSLHEAVKLAAGADTVLDRSQVVATLKEAVVDHGLVFGTSRHKGRLRKNIRTPRDAAKEIIPFLSRNKVAIVFGNEVNGLTREDLALCSEIMAIPSSDAFPSLNLSHAVMVIAYELFLAAQTHGERTAKELAPVAIVEDFYQHLRTTLMQIEFLNKNEAERMMFTLRQLFGRSRLGRRDVAVLRGILSAMERTREVL